MFTNYIMPAPLQARSLATSSWELVVPSIKLALKNYEQIAILFFLPSLFIILGTFYFGDPFIHNNKLIFDVHLNSRQEIGVVLIAVWFILSIFNDAPSIYFRLKVAESNAVPSLTECYRNGIKLFVRVWLSQIITWVFIAIGLILFIVPGVILFRRYILSPYYAAKYPRLHLAQVFRKSAGQSRAFAAYVYSTFGVIILINLALSVIFGSFAFGEIVYYILTYGILFLPALRFVEIVKASSKAT